jgi:glycosyltransferase involved in cell wall biosynthesis
VTGIPVSARPHEPSLERLERAEELFADGDVTSARRMLSECLADPATPVEHQVQALNDLGVIANAQGCPDEAERLLLGAVSRDAGYVPALENLAALCARDDPVQATYWARRAAEAHPGAGETMAGETMAGETMAGETAAGELAELAPRDETGVPCSTAAPRALSRVLIVVDYFYPSLGGSERLAEAAGATLQAQGLTVEVATRRLPQRTAREHRGMLVHEIDPERPEALQTVVAAGAYDGMLIFSAPTSWPIVASLRLPAPRPRIVAVPCINAENSAALRANPAMLHAYADLIATADVVGYSSHSGCDARLCEDLGLGGVYVPNAVERVSPRGELPGLAGGAPLLLVVANMWPEKNHAGLLRALRDHPGRWRLAIIGEASPEAPHVAEEVRQLANADPRVHLLGPADPGTVAAAMTQATALLLPSLAEATPLVVLEAMSHRLPWIATPNCGAVHDHAGGLILPVRMFGEGIDFLLDAPAAAGELGAAGLAHWEASYTWDVMGPRYADILRGTQVDALAPPARALAATEDVRARFYERRARSEAA